MFRIEADTPEYLARKARGNAAQQVAERYFESRGYEWHNTGYESYFPRRIIAAVISQTPENEALTYLRYHPDYYVRDPVSERACMIDVKATWHVEQNCWKHYERLQAEMSRERGLNVYLWIIVHPASGYIYSVAVNRVKFMQDDWRYSRNGSGTPYKTIDPVRSEPQRLKLQSAG